MSVVASFIDRAGVVHLASDSLTSDDDSAHTVREPKTCRWDGFGFGVVGSGRVANIVTEIFEPPRVDEDMYTYMVRSFVKSLQTCLTQAGADLSSRNSDDEPHEDFELLVARSGRVFVVDASMQVSEPGARYHAIGSGSAWATGSMHTTAGFRWSGKTIVSRAVAAANAYSKACGGGIRYERVEK